MPVTLIHRASLALLICTVMSTAAAQDILLISDLSVDQWDALSHESGLDPSTFERDVSRARMASLAATAIPIGVGTAVLLIQDDGMRGPMFLVLVAGIIAGPSVGSYMLGDSRRALTGVLIRTAASGALAGSAILRFGAGWGEHKTEIFLTNAMIGVSMAALGYGLAYNFLTLRASAREASLQAGLTIHGESGTMMPALRVRF